MANEFLQPSFFDNSTAKNPDVDVALLEEQSNARSILSLAGATTLQTVAILDGSITPTGAHIAVDTEGQAPSDELININPIRSEVDVIHDGMILQLQAVDDARVVKVKHSSEVGGIRTLSGQDIVLGTSWRLELQYIGGSWVEIAGKAQRDAEVALSSFSTTAAVGKSPVAIDDGEGNPVFDDTVKEAMGAPIITQTINYSSADASATKVPSEKAVSLQASDLRQIMEWDDIANGVSGELTRMFGHDFDGHPPDYLLSISNIIGSGVIYRYDVTRLCRNMMFDKGWGAIQLGDGPYISVPAGGTWFVFANAYPSGAFNQHNIRPIVKIVAGGTSITEYSSGFIRFGFMFRIQ